MTGNAMSLFPGNPVILRDGANLVSNAKCTETVKGAFSGHNDPGRVNGLQEGLVGYTAATVHPREIVGRRFHLGLRIFCTSAKQNRIGIGWHVRPFVYGFLGKQIVQIVKLDVAVFVNGVDVEILGGIDTMKRHVEIVGVAVQQIILFWLRRDRDFGTGLCRFTDDLVTPLVWGRHIA